MLTIMLLAGTVAVAAADTATATPPTPPLEAQWGPCPLCRGLPSALSPGGVLKLGSTRDYIEILEGREGGREGAFAFLRREGARLLGIMRSELAWKLRNFKYEIGSARAFSLSSSQMVPAVQTLVWTYETSELGGDLPTLAAEMSREFMLSMIALGLMPDEPAADGRPAHYMESWAEGVTTVQVIMLSTTLALADATSLLCGNQNYLQPDFNVRVIEWSGPGSSAVLRELDESNRFVQKSAESTSI
jgi:hypothetical protein